MKKIRGMKKGTTFVRKYTPPKGPQVDLIGHRVGTTTIVGSTVVDNRTRWLCKCDCGETVVRSTSLAKRTQSCGCSLQPVRSKPTTDAAKNDLIKAYACSARYRGHTFDLSDEKFFTLVSMNCSYCGIPPSQVRKMRGLRSLPYIYTGIDRKDNTVGYTLANCVPCCRICNRAKSVSTHEEFITWLTQVGKYWK